MQATSPFIVTSDGRARPSDSLSLSHVPGPFRLPIILICDKPPSEGQGCDECVIWFSTVIRRGLSLLLRYFQCCDIVSIVVFIFLDAFMYSYTIKHGILNVVHRTLDEKDHIFISTINYNNSGIFNEHSVIIIVI